MSEAAERTVLMNWIKRIGLWSVSVLAAEVLAISAFLVIMSSLSPASNSTAPFGSGAGLLVGFMILGRLSIFLLIPGWLLALPLILIFRRVDGWRFWILGTLVTLLGPVIAGFGSSGSIRNFDFSIAEWGLGVSFLSITMYLTAFRYLSRDSIEQAPS